ncbi:hypothetical protein CCR95_22280 [Thiocystis minor]|nr:hypothetical protein [Thiocystis minor]
MRRLTRDHRSGRASACHYQKVHEKRCREHYPRGTQVPLRSAMLGVFETPEAARACCEQVFGTPLEPKAEAVLDLELDFARCA